MKHIISILALLYLSIHPAAGDKLGTLTRDSDVVTGSSSATGGAGKVPLYDSSGNLKTYNVSVAAASGYALPGNIILPNQQGVWWNNSAGDRCAAIRYWQGLGLTGDHDSSGGELIIEAPWRIAIIGTGPIQFGANNKLCDAQHLRIVCGAADSDEGYTMKRSKAILFQTLTWTDSAQVENAIAVQAVPLNTSGTNSVLRFFSRAGITGADGQGGYSSSLGLCTGTQIAEMAEAGMWTPGTNPAYVVLNGATDPTWTMSKYLNHQNAKITLTGDRTLTFADTLEGMSGTLVAAQDASGNHSLTLPTGSKTPDAGDGVLTLSTGPNAVDVLSWDYDGSAIYWTMAKTFSGPLDTDAQTYITAASMTDTDQKTAVNTFVLGLKSAGIWTKLEAVYPFAGANTSTAHSKDLKGSHHIVDSGEWTTGVTHDANGSTGNGTSGYGNTGFAPSSFGSTSSQFLYVYSKTQSPTGADANTRIFLGSWLTGTARSMFGWNKPGGTAYLGITGLNAVINTNNYSCAQDFRGHLAGYIIDGTTQACRQGAAETTYAATATARSTKNFYLFAGNYDDATYNYCGINMGLCAIGQTLTASEQTTFRGLVDALMTALGRQN